MRTVQMSSPVEYRQQPFVSAFNATRRVLVTGGAGYLGSTLVRHLLSRQYRVRVLDSLLFGEESLASLRTSPGFEFVKGDVRNPAMVAEAIRDCDAVVHLAAIVGDRACESNYLLACDVNAGATRVVLQACRSEAVQRVLFASTCSVYGASEQQVDESGPLNPVSHYARTKIASERLVLDAVSYGLHPTVLRLGTLFGMSPRPRFDLVVNLLTAQAASLGRISVFNGAQWRPFVHVADAARAFAMCLEAELSLVSGQILNVGDSRLNLRLSDISWKIQSLLPMVKTRRLDNEDRRSYSPSFEKIRTRLGFCAERLIEDGIIEIHNAVKTGQIEDFTQSRYSNGLALAAT